MISIFSRLELRMQIPADIDGDSVMDVLASSSTTSNGLVWYEYQSGTSSFSEAQVISNTHSADTLKLCQVLCVNSLLHIRDKIPT